VGDLGVVDGAGGDVTAGCFVLGDGIDNHLNRGFF